MYLKVLPMTAVWKQHRHLRLNKGVKQQITGVKRL